MMCAFSADARLTIGDGSPDASGSRPTARELDVGGLDQAARRRQRGPRDRVLELADVARPVVLHQPLDGVRGQRLVVRRRLCDVQ